MRAIVRLGRAIIFRPGPSSEQLTAPRRLLSTKKADANEEEDIVKDHRDVDFVAQLQALQPSENFKKTLNGLEIKQLNSILPELELFVYMGSKVPQALNDDEWTELLKRKTVAHRVEYLTYVAVKHRRENNIDSKASKKEAQFRAYIDEQTAIAEAGGMGYGPRLNELIINPFRKDKQMNLLEGSRIWTAMRLGRPDVIFDLQFTNKMIPRDYKVLTRHMSYCITENFHARHPLPLAFANASTVQNEFRSLEHNIGQFKNDYANQTIMPTLSTRDIRSLYPDHKEIVYISRFAREVLDGPLKANAYVICASMDMDRESLGAARKGGFRAARLPIQKYVKWVSGGQVLPFPNIMRILREVHTSGGDWSTALHNNISKRHLESHQQREQKGTVVRSKLIRTARQELIQAICDATGNK